MTNRDILNHGAIIALTSLLASCASVDRAPETLRPGVTQDYYSAHETDYLTSLATLPENAFKSQDARYWWENFQDPLLNRLVYESLNRSFDTKRALANVEQAEAILRGVRADLLPTVDLNGDSVLFDVSDADVGTSLDLEWNVDLFGRTRTTVRQAQSNLANSQANVQDIRRLILAQVSQAYTSYRTTEARIALSQSNLKRLVENKSRITRLVDNGYSSKLDLNRAETQISQLRSNIVDLEAQKTATRNAIALIVQAVPQDLQSVLSDSSASTLSLPTQISQPRLDYIVRHRPDIRASEWALVGATQSRQAAQLALYPDITLGGDVLRLGSLGNLANFGNVSSSLFASIVQPLLGRGRLLANIDQENAQVKQALINYEETVFEAVLDIDTALENWARRQDQVKFDKHSLETAIEAQQLAERLFFAGETNFTAVIVAENTRLAAEETYLLTRQAAFESYISYSAATVPNW